MEEMEFRILEFLNDMSPTSLPWSSQSPRNKFGFGVFWSAEKTSNHTSTYLDHSFSIQDRIKTALSAFNCYYFPTVVLIQFWAATTTVIEGGRRLLITSNQPFAINYLPDEKLIQYKKDCPKYKFVAKGEEDHNLTDDGPVSRVFRTQLPEMCPDVSNYSVKEYPERDLALGCGFKTSLVLPVLEPNLQFCVGVLELLFTKCIDIELYHYPYSARRILQASGLDTVNEKQFNDQMQEAQFVPFKKELKGAMAHVSETCGLPLVCFWTRCQHMNFLACDVNCMGELPVLIPEMLVFDHNSGSCNNYLSSSFSQPIRVDQGLVAKVFHTGKPCFCRDVTQLNIIDYPLAHFERLSKFTGRFAVCLQCIGTKFRAYVLEFFLPPDKSHSGDLQNFLSSILTILKQHLKLFEVVNIGNDLFTEIGYLNESSDTSFTSFHTISSLSTSSGHETTSSSRSIESTMNSMQRKLNIYTRRSSNRSYLAQFPSKINEPVDSETGSSGRVMSASQYQVRTMKESRGDSSPSNVPRSEGSAAIARTIPPNTMVDVEMVTVNENYDEEL